jgi:hypothetical protein
MILTISSRRFYSFFSDISHFIYQIIYWDNDELTKKQFFVLYYNFCTYILKKY